MNKWRSVRGGKNYGARSKVRHADKDVKLIVSYYDEMVLPDPEARNGRRQRLEILRARAVVHTLYASAGRASEIASLEREALHDGHLSECIITGKGGKDRPLLLTRSAQKAIQEYCRERDDNYPGLFISHGRNIGNPIGRGTVWSIVKRAASALGLSGFASPHAFRHHRAQQLLDDGMPIDTLQSYLGHASIELTRRVYAPNTSLTKLRKQFDQFSGQ